MRVRKGAAVDLTRGGVRVRHLVGWPEELVPGVPREVLPRGELLVLEGDDSGFYLFRYTLGDEFAGESWHQTEDDALDQAEFEFGVVAADWFDVPLDVKDSIAWVIAKLRAER